VTHICKENNKWEMIGYMLYCLHYSGSPYEGFRGKIPQKFFWGDLFTKILGGLSPLVGAVFLLWYFSGALYFIPWFSNFV
jgi:hypothetical protein